MPELQVPCPKLEVFRLGDALRDRVGSGGLPEVLRGKRFVLFVGSIEPRKNHRLLYYAWEDLGRDASFPDDVALAIVGAARWMSDELVHEIELNPALKDRIVLIGDAGDSELDALYSHCPFSVLPSSTKGGVFRRRKACLAGRSVLRRIAEASSRSAI